MINFSQRLLTIANMIKPCHNLIDVGCDHGYLSIYLTTNSIVEHCLNIDVNKAPLDSAIKNSISYHVFEKMSFQQNNGLSHLDIDYIPDYVTISGMGGFLISEIIENASIQPYYYVLQPNNNIPKLREWLFNHQWLIIDESIVYDNQIGYVVLKVKKIKQKINYDNFDKFIGPILRHEKNENTIKFFQHELKKLEAIDYHFLTAEKQIQLQTIRYFLNVNINEVANYFLKKYDVTKQEIWDNCGLFYNIQNSKCNNIVVGLDVTNDLIDTAIAHNSTLIITHHPIYLNNNKNIPFDKQHLINRLMEHHIAHLCLHTCYDQHNHGTSYQIIKKLPFILNIQPCSECNYVVIGNLKQTITLAKFVAHLDLSSFSQQPIIYDESLANQKINRIALCAGSGGFFIRNLIDKKTVDCYLCGDIKWHDWLDANDNHFPLIDISHASEAIFIEHIQKQLQKNFNLTSIKVYPKLRLKTIN